MKIVLVLVLVIHGLIHLLGFAKGFGLAEVPQLRGATLLQLGPAWQRPIAALWLVAGALVVTAAVMLALGTGGWWRLGLAALVLSQALVIYAWPDAKAGTVANLVLTVAVLLGWADARFDRATDAAVRRLFATVPSSSPVVTAADVEALPAPVGRWLDRSGVVGRPRVRAVRLRQEGGLRTGVDQPFLDATAEQYFAVDEPGFVWSVRLTMKGLPVAGRDAYLGGRGHMLIAAGALWPIVDATGDKIDQGSLLRFLGELIWFPGAAVAPYLRWQAIDDRSAEVTMTHAGTSATARFTFDDEGRVVSFAARRYLGGGAAARLEDWRATCTEWARFDGVEVPVRGVVTWKLAKGDFDYYRWHITAVEYDRPSRW